MAAIRDELVSAAISRAYALIDYNIHKEQHEFHEFRKQTILADESLTNDEKNEAMRKINEVYDLNKLLFNEGERRICENCKRMFSHIIL